MIRSARIPPILKRICTDQVIQTAILVTTDGELLGSTSSTFISSDGSRESIENLGTLIADIAVDYQRLGDEYALLNPMSHNPDSSNTSSNNNNAHGSSGVGGAVSSSNPNNNKKSHLKCLLLELEQGLVGVSSCVGLECLVIGIAAPNAPMGMIKARLQALTEHVQEALSPLTDTLYR